MGQNQASCISRQTASRCAAQWFVDQHLRPRPLDPDAAPLTAGIGLLTAYLLARQTFAGKQAFEFTTNDQPEANKFRFCPYCGKVIDAVAYSEEDDA